MKDCHQVDDDCPVIEIEYLTADHAEGRYLCLRFGLIGNAHRGVHSSQRR